MRDRLDTLGTQSANADLPGRGDAHTMKTHVDRRFSCPPRGTAEGASRLMVDFQSLVADLASCSTQPRPVDLNAITSAEQLVDEDANKISAYDFNKIGWRSTTSTAAWSTLSTRDGEGNGLGLAPDGLPRRQPTSCAQQQDEPDQNRSGVACSPDIPYQAATMMATMTRSETQSDTNTRSPGRGRTGGTSRQDGRRTSCTASWDAARYAATRKKMETEVKGP